MVLRWIGQAVRTMARWWRRLSDRRRHFIRNIALGTLFSLIFAGPVANSPPSAALSRLAFNAQLGLWRGTSLAPDLAFIDVDDAAYEAWGARPVTRRDKLCRLIGYAVHAHARAVVVDFDLTSRDSGAVQAGSAVSCDATSPPDARSSSDGDATLEQFLRRYAERCASTAQRCVPIVLARPLQTAGFSGDGARIYAERVSFLDASISGMFPVLWGTVDFAVDRDGVVRRWRLWDPVCRPRPRALPSAILLAAVLYAGAADDGELRRRIAAAQSSLDAEFAPVCRMPGRRDDLSPGPDRAISIDIGAPHGRPAALFLTTDALSRTFAFRFGSRESGERTLGITVPALAVTEATADHRFDERLLSQHVVLIGSSARDNADRLQTPIGPMPGALVLLNAIDAALSEDYAKQPPLFDQLALELFAVVAASVLFLRAPRTISFAVLVTVSVILSSSFFAFGNMYWLDPVPPLIAIGAHEATAHGAVPFVRRGQSVARRGIAWVRRQMEASEEEPS